MRKYGYGGILLLCISIFSTPAVTAQIGGGTIQGLVSDQTGAVIPDASVSAKNEATGVVTTRKATGAGFFNLSPLQPGDYSITVTAQGFGPHTDSHVHLDGLQTVSVNAKLVPGTTEVVNVTTPVLNDANGTVGDTVNSQDYQLLPLQMSGAPRDPTAFTKLANGVDTSGRYNGAAVAYHNETYLDGVVATDINAQGSSTNTSLGAIVEAVDESEVQTVGISAKFQGQGFNNFTMRSGTNDWHGSVFEYFRNTALDTWGYLAPRAINPATGKATKPIEKQNEYGFVLGGPIIKDKLFFFIGGERMAYRKTPNPSYFTLPTLAMRQGDFSGFAAATGYHIYDQTTTTCINNGANCRRNQFTGDVIPQSRLSPLSLAAQKFLPTNLANANYTNNFLYSQNQGYNFYKASAKVDWQMVPSHRLTFAYLVGQRGDPPGLSDSGSVLPLPYSATFITTLYNVSAIVGDTWTISSKMVNSFKYSYFRGETIQQDPTFQSKYAVSTLGLQNVPPGWAAGSFFKIYFGGNYGQSSWDGSGSTLNTNRPQNLVTNTYGITDDLQWTRGRHNISIGGQMIWYQYNSALPATGTSLNMNIDNTTSAMFTGQEAPGASTPVYGKSSVSTTSGNAYAGFLQGTVTSIYVADQRNLGVLGGRFKAASPYVQDDWKVNNALTLNLGLRWDIYSTYSEVQDRMSFFNPDIPNPVAIGAKGVIEYNGFRADNPAFCQCHNRWGTYLGNIEPRLGMAFTADDHTVFRASYGISATHANGTGGRGGAREGTNQIGLGPSNNYTSATGYDSPFQWDNPLPTPPPATLDETFGVGYTTVPGHTGSPQSVFYDEPYLARRSPYYQNFGFGIQRAVTYLTTVSVDYSGSLGRFIYNNNGHSIYSNQIAPQYLVLGSLLTSPANTANLAAANAILAANGLGAISLPFSNFNPAANIGQALRPFPHYTISNNFQSDGNSGWNAFEFQLKQKPWHGLSMTVNYTYSRLIDNIANRPSTYNHAYAWNLDNGPHSLKAYGSWSTPAVGSNWIEKSLTKGWLLSSIYTFNSGNPLTFSTSCASYFSYFGACRTSLNTNFAGTLMSAVPYGSANLNGQSAFVPSGASVSNAPFVTSTTQFGNTPVANPLGVTPPNTSEWDASVRRTFGPFERVRLTIGADMFNVTNHVEATGINTNITSSAFGTASSQSNQSRDVQLNAKFEF